MVNNIDINRNGWLNGPYSFTQLDIPSSPAFVGTSEEFKEHMKSNKSLFERDTSESIYKSIHLDNPVNSIAELDFAKQKERFGKLNESLKTTRLSGKNPNTRLIGFDLETLRVDVARPYAVDNLAAITEFGITDTTVLKTKSKHSSYSIAGGINKDQLAQYLAEFKQFKEKGLDSFDSSKRGMIESLMDRLSVYGQVDNISDLYKMEHITNLGKVVTINPSAAFSGKKFDPLAIEKGIMHLSVLGGITEEEFSNALTTAKFIATPNSKYTYSGVIESFEKAGLKVQVLDKKSKVDTKTVDKILNYFTKAFKDKEHTFGIGYNTNVFDLNVIKHFFGDDVLNKENVLDTYTALKSVSKGQDIAIANQIAMQNGMPVGINRLTSQEGMATAQGISTGVAHNAGFDSRVANELISKPDFLNGKSLPQLVTETETPNIQKLADNKKIFYALNSVAFDKNGSDYLEDGSILNTHGIQRGRYYSINDIKQYEDGRIAVKFVTATDNKTFIKVFDTSQDLEKIMRENFLVDNGAKKGVITSKIKSLNDAISDADKARRNYEDLFSTRNLTIKDKKFEGGFEKLNQYYKAYKISSEQLGEINPDTINKIIAGEKDDVLIPALKEAFDIPEDKEVYKSLLRDFKSMFGRIHDESEMLEYITSTLNNTDLDIHQKTLAANRMRINIEGLIDERQYQRVNTKDYSKAARRDLFDVELFINDSPTRINFESDKAVQSLTSNFYAKSTTKSSMNVASHMVDSVVELHERGIVDEKFLEDFYQAAGVENKKALNLIVNSLEKGGTPDDEIAQITSKFVIRPTSEIQPRKLAEMLTSYIQNTYVKPIQRTGYNYSNFVHGNGDFSVLGNEKLINFMKTKTETLSGNISLNKATGNKYINTKTNELVSFSDIFNTIDKQALDNKTQKIVSHVGTISTTLEEGQIKHILMNDLNFTEESAKEGLRMLDTQGSYGIGTHRDGTKTKYITQFAYSGKKGDDAFVLVNYNKDRNTNLAKTMEIMADETLDFSEKINLIKENGYSAVLPFKAIEKFEIEPDEELYSDPLAKLIDIDGNEINYSMNTIKTGSKGYKKMSQYHLSAYDQKTDDLSDFIISLTDDGTSANQAYRKVRDVLFGPDGILNDETMSESERFIKATKSFIRAENNIISDMPGPTGYFSLPVDGKWIKASAPTVADRMLSSQISIQPLESFVLQTAKKDLEVAESIVAKGMQPDTSIVDMIIKLSGQDPNGKKDRKAILEDMIAKAKNGENVTPQFNEFFYKHLLVPMNMEEGKFANDIDMSVMDYIEKSLSKEGYTYHKTTRNTLQWLISNKDKLSQLVKEKALYKDKRIYLLNPLEYNQYSELSSPIRPVGNQVQGAQPFILKNVKDEMADVAEKLNLSFGYDAKSIKEAQMRKAFKNFEIEGTSLKYKDLETAITANVKQMDSIELIGKVRDIETNFDEYFESIYKNAGTKFSGISEEQSRALMKETFNIIKAHSSNVYEDRAVARMSFGDNQAFTRPEVVTVEFNAIDEEEYEYLLKSKNSPLSTIQKNGYIERGQEFILSDGTRRKYHGPTGYINTDEVKDFFVTGKGHMVEETQGTRAVKTIIGNNEKVTLNIIEYDRSHSYDKLRHLLGNTISERDAKEVLKYYSEFIYDKLFGENVSIVTNASIYKHGSMDIPYGSVMNTIFYNYNNYQGKSKTKAFNEIQKMFVNADANGYRIYQYDGDIVYDTSQMGKGGVITQLRKVRDEIFTRAENPNDKYQSLWKSIANDIKYQEENQIYRAAIAMGYRTEATGGAMFTDPRAQTNFELKFLEEIDELNTDLDDFANLTGISTKDEGPMTFQRYILKALREESVNGYADTSVTPINPVTAQKYKSSLKTVKGIELAKEYIDAPEKLGNSNMILDLQLDQINFIPSGSDASLIVDEGIFKLVDKNGNVYSKQLQALVGNKNLDDIAALRITLPDGMYFNSIARNDKGKSIKKVNQLLVPLYDLTPYKGEVQYTQRIRDLNNVIEMAKNFGKTKGIEESQNDLDAAVKKLYKTIVGDLNSQNKESYIYQTLLRLPMKNSKMMHGESSIAPVVNAMFDENYKENQHLKWYDVNNKAYRDEVIEAIKTGDIKYDIDLAQAPGKYTTKRNEKLYYDDVVEISREGFEELGIDFKKSGRDIYYDLIKNEGNNYRPLIKEMEHGFFDIDYADWIASHTLDDGNMIETEEVLDAMLNRKKYETLNKSLKNQDKFVASYLKKNSDKTLADANAYYHKLIRERDMLETGFERITEKYLEDVGIFSFVGRWPTKDEGGTNVAIIRLNKYLAKHDIRATPALTARLHLDFDGDNPFTKLFKDIKEATILSRNKHKKLLTSLTKSYESQVFKEFIDENGDKYASRNNKEVAKIVQDIADKMEKSNVTREITLQNGEKILTKSPAAYVSDMVDGKINTDLERTMLDSFLSEKGRKRILTQLGLDHMAELGIKDYSDEVTHAVFTAWDSEYGNMLKNLDVLMAAIKARENKTGIGIVSNVDYKLNQILLEVMTDELQKGNVAQKKELNRIKTLLHVGATGFLPETEQKAIDVKHVKQGAALNEVDRFNRGVNYLFKGGKDNIEIGKSLIRDAMKSKFDNEEQFEKSLDALVNFSQNKKAKALYDKFLPANIRDSLEENIDFARRIEEQSKYFLENGMTPATASRANLQAIQDLKTAFNMGYYHNDVLQSLVEGQVFVSTEKGVPVLYQATSNLQSSDGKYVVNFSKIGINDLKNQSSKWTETESIRGTAIEIQSVLQEKFGDYKAYSVTEVLGNVDSFKQRLRNTTAITNAQKYADMYSKGNTEMANKFLQELELNKKYNSKAIDNINYYRNAVTEQQYNDFIQKVKFIKSNTNYQKRGRDGKYIFKSNPDVAEDLLANINKQIIEQGKKANPTSTSVIFDDALKQIANDIGMQSLDTENFTNVEKITSEIFKDYENSMIDIQRANKSFSDFTNIQDQVEDVLNKYRVKNQEYLNPIKHKIKSSVALTSELDDIFGWNSDSFGNMRVGIDTHNNLFGRRFQDLSEADIEEIMNFKNADDAGLLSDYALEQTKNNLREFQKNNKITGSQALRGASDNDINMLRQLNEAIKQNAKAAGEGANAKGKKAASEHAGKLLKKTLADVKEGAGKFIKTTPGKVVMGLAALGLVSNLLDSGNSESPLAPELNQKESTGPINNSSVNAKAPSSNTGKKVVYSDSSSGLHFKMSAKSKNKINQMNAAKQLAAQTGGDTNINVYDDRSQISSNWLERKFSEIM